MNIDLKGLQNLSGVGTVMAAEGFRVQLRCIDCISVLQQQQAVFIPQHLAAVAVLCLRRPASGLCMMLATFGPAAKAEAPTRPHA